MGYVGRTLLLMVAAYLCFQNTEAVKCDGKTSRFMASPVMNSIHSPGYPSNYESNDECTWVISLPLANGLYMLQIIAMDFDLDDYREDCSTDYLEIFEGDSASGMPAKKWCGSMSGIFKTKSLAVTLRFKSDAFFTSRGFSISYSYVAYAPADCKESVVAPIKVGTYPVYESFRPSSVLARCEWKIQATDQDKKLVIELYKASKISCKDGLYSFYEGDLSSGHVSFQYCSTLKPFSVMYLQSNMATLTFDLQEGAQIKDDQDELILKLSTRTSECSSSDKASIEVRGDPVFFSLPYAMDRGGTPCPVTLMTQTKSESLRLDVMGTVDQEATCNSDLVIVKDSNSGKDLSKMCSPTTKTPVYRQEESPSIEVSSKSQLFTFLRAASVPTQCNGLMNERVAVPDLFILEVIPSAHGFSDLSYCKYVIVADEATDVVSLTIKWDLTEGKDAMSNQAKDFISVYDGRREMDALLYTSFDSNYVEHVDKKVVSTGQHILLVIHTDARQGAKPLHLSYHSIPGGKHCPDDRPEVKVNRSPQTITSPNYPSALTLFELCLIHLVSENPEDDLVVEVVESDMLEHCGDQLAVIDGDYKMQEGYNVLGRVCGRDKPVFTLPKQDVTLLTSSKDKVGPGGWKVKVYTKARSKGSPDSGLRLGLKGWLVWAPCIIGGLVGLVFM